MTNLKNPVFIIGCPRSGKSLAAAILNKHPGLFILFESHIFSSIYRKWTCLCRSGKVSPSGHFAAVIEDEFGWYNKKFGLSREDIIDCARRGAPDWGGMLDIYMTFLMSRAKPGAGRWGDKTPHHVGSLTHISRCYPDARFIYMKRDPLDIIADMTDPRYPHATNSHIVNAEIFKQYFDVYRTQKKTIGTDTVLEVRYEDLISGPEAAVRRICGFLNVDYSVSLLEPGNGEIRQLMGWQGDRAWDKVSPQPAAKIFPETVKIFAEAYLGDYIDQAGYGRRPVNFPALYKTLAWFRGSVFRLMRSILAVFWNKKYPGFPFLMMNYPAPRTVMRWIGFSQRG